MTVEQPLDLQNQMHADVPEARNERGLRCVSPTSGFALVRTIEHRETRLGGIRTRSLPGQH